MQSAKERCSRSGVFAMGTKTIAEANLYNDVLFLFSCYGNTDMTGLILGIIWASRSRCVPSRRRTRWGNGRATTPRRWTPTCSGRDSLYQVETLHRGGAHPEKPFPLGASRLPRLPYRERDGKKYGHGKSLSNRGRKRVSPKERPKCCGTWARGCGRPACPSVNSPCFCKCFCSDGNSPKHHVSWQGIRSSEKLPSHLDVLQHLCLDCMKRMKLQSGTEKRTQPDRNHHPVQITGEIEDMSLERDFPSLVDRWTVADIGHSGIPMVVHQHPRCIDSQRGQTFGRGNIGSGHANSASKALAMDHHPGIGKRKQIRHGSIMPKEPHCFPVPSRLNSLPFPKHYMV